MASSLLAGPILPTLLRLAGPNILAMTTSVLVGVAETYYIGLLGVAPLAAIAVVFPFAMLTQMMSAGAMGGGVSSALSRALGARNPARARALAQHAVVIGALAGVVYSIVFLACGPAIYRLLGASGVVLEHAIGYANVLFSGAILIWLLNTLASILRGSGNMDVPSAALFVVALAQIALGGALGLGLGPMPRLGMPGVALGQLIATAGGVAFLSWRLMRADAPLRLALTPLELRGELFADILRVGALACVSPVLSVLAIVTMTGLVARLGVDALAGYGIGQRLEFLLIPIAFGIGVASVPMVGLAIGAGKVERARRVAWTAAIVSSVNLGAVGALVALAPRLWSGMFSDDANVLAAAAQYLRWAGPAFAFFGFGLTLYFASQGSGRVLGPVLAGLLRLVVIAAGGALLARAQAPAWSYFALVGLAMVVYGVGTGAAVRLTRWQPAPARATAT